MFPEATLARIAVRVPSWARTPELFDSKTQRSIVMTFSFEFVQIVSGGPHASPLSSKARAAPVFPISYGGTTSPRDLFAGDSCRIPRSPLRGPA
jgi:hypothetical protein